MLMDKITQPTAQQEDKTYHHIHVIRTVTGQLADWTSRGLDNSRTGHLADWSTSGLDN